METTLEPGDVIDASGALTEDHCNTQLEVTDWEHIGLASPLPPVVIDADDVDEERYEGMLVTLRFAQVVSQAGTQFELASGAVAVGDLYVAAGYDFDLAVSRDYHMTGLIRQDGGEVFVAPRGPDDALESAKMDCVNNYCKPALPNGKNFVIVVATNKEQCGEHPNTVTQELYADGIDTYVIGYRSTTSIVDELSELAVAGGHATSEDYPGGPRYHRANTIKDLEQKLADGLGTATCEGTYDAQAGCTLTFDGTINFLTTWMTEGFYDPNGDWQVDLEMAEDVEWTIIPGLGPTVTAAEGSITYVALDDLTTFEGEATAEHLELVEGLELDDVTVGAKYTTDGAWKYTLDGDATIGPFGVALEGVIEKEEFGPVTGCLSGTLLEETSIAGFADFTEMSVQTCVMPDGSVVNTFDALIVLAGLELDAEGEIILQANGQWSIDVTVFNLDLDLITFQTARLLYEKGGSHIEFFGEFVIPGLSALYMTAEGQWLPDGDYELTVGLQEGTSWQPFPSLLPELEFTELTGLFRRYTELGLYEKEVTITATQGPGVNLLGIDIAPLTLSGTYLKVNGNKSWSFTLSGTADMPFFGAIDLEGVIEQTSPGAPFSGSLYGTKAELDVLGLHFEPLTLGLEIKYGSIDKYVIGGEVGVFGAGTQAFDGFFIPGSPWAVELNFATLGLTDDLSIDNVTLSYKNGSTDFDLLGEIAIDINGATNHFLIEGNYDYDDLNFELLLKLQPGETWGIPQIGLEFGAAEGYIKVKQSTIEEAYVEVDSGQSINMAGVLTLSNIKARVEYDDGDWALSLSGTTTAVFGGEQWELEVEASFDTQGNMTLIGDFVSTGSEPFKSWIGGGTLIITKAAVTLIVETDGDFTFTVAADAKIRIQKKYYETTVQGGYIVKANSGEPPVTYVSGILPTLNVPFLGTANDVVFVISTDDLDQFDIFFTPDDETDDIDAEQGLTIATKAAAPSPLSAFADELTFLLYLDLIDLDKMRLQANVPLDWTVIDSGSVFEYVDLEKLTFSAIGVFIDIDKSNYEIGMAAQFDFWPVDHDMLLGTAEFSINSVGNLEIASFVEGIWIEPLGLTDFAAQNPGFSIAVTPAGTPSSVGFNIDMFWKRGQGMQWPGQDDDWWSFTGPDMAAIGASFFFDTTVSESGLCFGGGSCLELSPFMARVEISQITFPTDTLRIMIAFFNATSDVFGGFLPPIEIDIPSIAPLEIDIDYAKFYASTHALDLFNIDFAPGFELVFDAVLFSFLDVLIVGYVDNSAMDLTVIVQPFDILGVEFTGNPFAKVARTNKTGYVQVDHDSRMNADPFTIEGWVYRDQWFGGDLAGILAKKDDGQNGWVVHVGDADPETGDARVFATIHNGGQTRTVKTQSYVVAGDAWTHVAVAIDSVNFAKPKVAIWVDGRQARLEDEGPDIGPGTNGQPVFLGFGMDAIDDVRMWNTKRVTPEVKAESRVLPSKHYENTTLIFRYMFDYDQEETNSMFTSVPATDEVFNSRLYTSGNKMHGTYAAGSEADLSDDQELYFRMRYSLIPGPAGLLDSGFWINAGLDVNVPVLDQLGFWNPKATVQVAIGEGEMSGEFFIKPFTLIPIPLIGEFQLSGFGPNMVEGDADDGTWGAFNLTYWEIAANTSMRFNLNPALNNGNPWSQTFASAWFDYYCVQGDTCSPLTNELEIGAEIDLTIPLGGLGDTGIKGTAIFDTTLPGLTIDGHLVLLGHDFVSGYIEWTDSHLLLESTMDLPTIAGFDLGIIEVGAELTYSPFRLCAWGGMDLNAPLLGSVGGDVEICLGANPSFLFSATLNAPTVLGFKLKPTVVQLSTNSSCSPGTVSCSKDDQCSSTQLCLDGKCNAKTCLEGLYITTGMNFAGIIDANFEGWVKSNGDFKFEGDATISAVGQQLAGAYFKWEPSGIYIGASVSVLGQTVSVSGTIQSSGWFELTGSVYANVLGLGFTFDVTVNNDGVKAKTTINLAGIIKGSAEVTMTSSFAWSLSGSVDLTIAGWGLGGGSIATSGSGVSVNSFELCIKSPDFGSGQQNLCGNINNINNLNISGSGSLNFAGYKLASASFSLSKSGFSLSGAVDCIIFSVGVSGTVNTNLTFNLTGSAGVNIFGTGATVAATFYKGGGLSFGLGGSVTMTVFGATLADGSFAVIPPSTFELDGTVNLGANLGSFNYPCPGWKTQCINLVCADCTSTLYGVCVGWNFYTCQQCAQIPWVYTCSYSPGYVGCTASVHATTAGWDGQLSASCSIPIIGTIGVSLDIGCGSVCATFNLFGISANICTPCLF